MSILIKRSEHSGRIEARNWQVRGRVQGIGFRPFVYRLASELGLRGHISNTGAGAEIVLEGPAIDLDQFTHRMISELPTPGHIDECKCEHVRPIGAAGITIDPSIDAGPRRVRIPADRAICIDCRRDIHDTLNHRHHYPFTACTSCGPRFSIIESLPYDRAATSLREFPLCDRCAIEYRTPNDRRFHAQAIVCSTCGPKLSFASKAQSSDDSRESLKLARRCLTAGQCLALKGLGGYQLLVRADDDSAVARLRQRKHRPAKPFAVMVRTVAWAEMLAEVNPQERIALTSSENPIVLLTRRPDASLSSLVAPNINTIGLFLPTTPLHELLLQDCDFPVVATSGNATDEPPAISANCAHHQLAAIADAFLDHDRPIVRRLDDSVVRVIADRPVVMRLGRGFAPCPLPSLERFAGPPTLALGGHLKSAIAAFTGEQALLLQLLGDMDGALNRAGFAQTVEDVQRLYGFHPKMLVVDQHPDYFTTRWAERQGLPLIRVQHHHAHAAAVQAEYGLLDHSVLAVTWDGTGYGSDGTIWGGEFLITQPDGRFDRIASLRPIPLIGGEAAIREPKRIAFGLLWGLLGPTIVSAKVWLRHLDIAQEQATNWAKMLQQNVNVVWSSAVGRLLDGFAMLALGGHDITYEAEAVIRLEDIADADEAESYSITHYVDGGMSRGDWRPMLTSVLDDLHHEVSPQRIAGKIHQTMANWAGVIAHRFPSHPVVLGGGCFQNRRLTERTMAIIGPRCHIPSAIPPGDGGLAVGQLAVALQQQNRQQDGLCV